jgi:hypothetical protein
MARARGGRTNVFVTIGAIKYGFAAGAGSSAHRADLGHTVFADQPGVVFGANSPKPNRASKIIANETISSFCDPSKEDDLRTAEWTILRNSRRRGITQSVRSRSVYVAMPGGYNYAWNITVDELDLANDLGFLPATGATANLVWGSSPKPPRASRVIAGSRVSSFIRPQQSIIDAAVTAGYSISGIDYALIPDV